LNATKKNRDDKTKKAEDNRKKVLDTLNQYVNINEFAGMDDLEEETGFCCVICQEG